MNGVLWCDAIDSGWSDDISDKFVLFGRLEDAVVIFSVVS